MSGIVLSSSVRQNLLSLQSTADLLATTQSRLSTGKKVNSALDNPTNFFTAASLDSRASDPVFKAFAGANLPTGTLRTHMIADVLDAGGDENVVTRVRGEVSALCRRFPVYGD